MKTLVPCRCRLSFHQYIPSKQHRCGIKVYKLCSNKGCTWNISVYVGRNLSDDENSVSERVIMKLVKYLVNEGLTPKLINFYISIPLSYRLLDMITYVVGTLRQNRKYIPLEIQNGKI